MRQDKFAIERKWWCRPTRGLTADTGLSWSGARRDRGGWQDSRGRMGVVNDGFRISQSSPSGFGLSLAVKRSARSTIQGLAGATVLAQMEQLSHLQRRQWKQKRKTQTTGGKDRVDGQSGGSGVHSWSSSPSGAPFRPHLAERGSITRTRATPPRKCELESSVHWAPTARPPAPCKRVAASLAGVKPRLVQGARWCC